jgi:Penicillin-insensitive murein endopeptidase
VPNQTALVELDDITWDDFPSLRPKQPTVMEIEVTITEDLPLEAAPTVGPVMPARRAVRAKRPVWPWVTMMTVAVSVLGVAALDGRGPAAAAPATESAVIEDAGAELPIAVPTRIGRSERAGPILDLNDASIASGGPNGGRLINGVRLPMRGLGYYTYDPSTQSGPQSPDRRWGTAMLVGQITNLGEWWSRTHPDQTPLGFGDLSLENGGHFGGPSVGHASHQNGLDVDIRLPRADGVAGPANPGNYDRALTQQIVDRLAAQGASMILIGPNLDLHGPGGVVLRWPNHDDHLHARFPDPDGSGN